LAPLFPRSVWRTSGSLAVLGMVLLLAACASVPRPAAQAPSAAAPPYDAWDRVVNRYVDEQGRVNFTGVQKDRADLDRFVAWVYDNGPQNKPELFPTPQAVLAYHI